MRKQWPIPRRILSKHITNSKSMSNIKSKILLNFIDQNKLAIIPKVNKLFCVTIIMLIAAKIIHIATENFNMRK